MNGCAALQNLSMFSGLSSLGHSLVSVGHQVAPHVQPATHLGDAIWGAVDPTSHQQYGPILTAGGEMTHSLLKPHTTGTKAILLI